MFLLQIIHIRFRVGFLSKLRTMSEIMVLVCYRSTNMPYKDVKYFYITKLKKIKVFQFYILN